MRLFALVLLFSLFLPLINVHSAANKCGEIRAQSSFK
jgi:hypothetical protein